MAEDQQGLTTADFILLDAQMYMDDDDPIYLHRKDQFMILGFPNDIASVMASRSWHELDVEQARKLIKMGATCAQALKILW